MAKVSGRLAPGLPRKSPLGKSVGLGRREVGGSRLGEGGDGDFGGLGSRGEGEKVGRDVVEHWRSIAQREREKRKALEVAFEARALELEKMVKRLEHIIHVASAPPPKPTPTLPSSPQNTTSIDEIGPPVGVEHGWGGEGSRFLRSPSFQFNRHPRGKIIRSPSTKCRKKQKKVSRMEEEEVGSGDAVPPKTTTTTTTTTATKTPNPPNTPNPSPPHPLPASPASPLFVGRKRRRERGDGGKRSGGRRRRGGGWVEDREESYFAGLEEVGGEHAALAQRLRQALHGTGTGRNDGNGAGEITGKGSIVSPTPSGYWTDLEVPQRWSETQERVQKDRKEELDQWRTSKLTEGRVGKKGGGGE